VAEDVVSIFDELTRGLPGEPVFEPFLRQDRKSMQGRRGKVRLLHKPNEAMKLLHTRLNEVVRRHRPEWPWATGAMPGISREQNALRHLGGRYFYLTDMKNAFPSVDGKRLALALLEILPPLSGSYEETYGFLKRYCLSEASKGLYMGSPAACDLFNLYCHRFLDERIGPYLETFGMTYTRYLDDLTVSSPEGRVVGVAVRAQVRKAIGEAGFAISHHKSQVQDLHKGSVIITGVGLRWDGQQVVPFVPPKYTNHVEGVIRAHKNGQCTKNKLDGKIAAILGTAQAAQKAGRQPSHREQRVLRRYQERQRTP
jgi:hypothetical protein